MTTPAPARRRAFGRLVLASALALTASCWLASRPAQAQSITGTITNTSSNTLGMQVYVGGTLPGICSSATQNGWMMIAAANKAMIGSAMIATALGTPVTLYSDGSVTSTGAANICNVTQIVSVLR